MCLPYLDTIADLSFLSVCLGQLLLGPGLRIQEQNMPGLRSPCSRWLCVVQGWDPHLGHPGMWPTFCTCTRTLHKGS